MTEEDHMTNEEYEYRRDAVVREMLRLTNYIGAVEDLATKFIEALKNEHRTIQASFIRGLFMILVHYATENSGTDLRNEAAVDACVKLLKDNNGCAPYIPFI